MTKQRGTHFLLKKMLYYFHDKKYIWFDQKTGGWSWDTGKLESAEISDNVIDFLISNIKSLGQNTRRMLTLAASIGDVFEFSVLFHLIDFPKKEVFDCLWEAMVHKLIYPLDAEYKYIKLNSVGFSDSTKSVKFKFQHDKVREAAYRMLDAESKMNTHLSIARALYKNSSENLDKESIIEVTKHYNLAIDLIKTEEEQSVIIELNLDF